MKSKFLFFSAILFFILGRHYHDELIFYFFSLQMFMLFLAAFFHKRELKVRAKRNAESLPAGDSSKS
jgi:hypothetical protein